MPHKNQGYFKVTTIFIFRQNSEYGSENQN